MIKSEKQKEKKTEDKWKEIKRPPEVPEGEEREKEIERIFEDIMAQNLPNLNKSIN